ncbi:unnamed protein product [Hyaloperonospora brassicae]|uniref:Homeobox domain-containing protein n=1 Tax=Hyaloperonospora brassicae TaxID=162125 RepID=A0AAV0T9Z8_HYABA|nr:unnamed protein product [Hyaloperonospora brassicae]
MTLPNRSGYVPGPRRQPRAETTAALPRRVRGDPPLRAAPETMQRELRLMLRSLSPAAGGAALPSVGPTSAASAALVGQCRNQLLEDESFQANERFQGLLLLANHSAVDAAPGAVDPFAAAMAQMPTSPQSPPLAFSASSDGEEEAGETSRSPPYVEAESLQTMAHAARTVVQDPTVSAEQQQQYSSPSPASAEKGGSSAPQLPMSLAGISPYAMELAARNSLPKKRSSLSKVSKKLMHDWFEHNLHHPYPTEEEKDWLAQRGGITLEQVNNWFINTRGRKWKPMLNRLMAEKQAGDCKLYDQMVEKIEEPYHKF